MKIKAGDKFSFLGYNCTVYAVNQYLMTFFTTMEGQPKTMIINIQSFNAALDAGKIKLL